VTDKSPEGFQFVHGFEGVGAFLKYFLSFLLLASSKKIPDAF
jgi:hypothetical protein